MNLILDYRGWREYIILADSGEDEERRRRKKGSQLLSTFKKRVAKEWGVGEEVVEEKGKHSVSKLLPGAAFLDIRKKD